MRPSRRRRTNASMPSVADSSDAGIRLLEDGKVMVVCVNEPNLLDKEHIETLVRSVREVLEANRKQTDQVFMLDMSSVTLIGAGALGAIIEFNKMLRQYRDRPLVLCGLQPEPRDLFTATHLDRIYRFYDTVELALASEVHNRTAMKW